MPPVSYTHLDVYKRQDQDTVAQVAAEEGYIRTEDQARLLAFRDNPSDTRWIQK